MFNGVFVIGFATLSSVLNIIVGDATTPLQSRADTLAMTRGRLCKFPLPLLCLYNGFSFYCGRTSGTTHARHNSFSPHSFCSSSPLAPPVQMHLRPRRTERERGRADTAPTDRRSGDGHVDDCCAQINGIVAALCNIQNQSKGEINDLCRRGAGGPPPADSQTQSTRSGGEKPASLCGAMLQRGSNHSHAASSQPHLYFLL